MSPYYENASDYAFKSHKISNLDAAIKTCIVSFMMQLLVYCLKVKKKDFSGDSVILKVQAWLSLE